MIKLFPIWIIDQGESTRLKIIITCLLTRETTDGIRGFLPEI
jgi:hypothetical protein